MAARFDFTIDRGSYKTYSFTLKESGMPMDLTGCKASMQVRRFASCETAIDTRTTENGRLKIDGASVAVAFSDTDTKSWPICKLCYDIRLVTKDGKKIRVVEGEIKVTPDVTRV